MRRLTSTLQPRCPRSSPPPSSSLLRWWTSRRREVFHIRPDEPGQLAIARFIGRGARWNMFDHSTWRPAYGTLISPVTWFTDDPTTQYRGALASTPCSAACRSSCWPSSPTGSRGRSRTMAAALAAIAVLAPAVLFTTNWVWSEALVQVSFLARRAGRAAVPRHGGDALGRRRWCSPRRSGSGPTAGCCRCPASPPSSSSWRRGRPPAARGRGPSRCSALLAVALVGVVGVLALRRRPGVGRPGGDEHRRRRARPARARRRPRPRRCVGQVWYQLVVTVGVAGLGTIALAARRAGGATVGRGRSTPAIVLGAVVPLVVLSIVFMTDRWRPDQIVYGRYNDAVMAPVVVAGLAAVVTSTRRRLLVDGLAVIAVTVAVRRRAAPHERRRAAGPDPAAPDGARASSGTSRTARLAVLDVTVSAVVVMAVGAGASSCVARRGRWRQGVALVVAAALLVVRLPPHPAGARHRPQLVGRRRARSRRSAATSCRPARRCGSASPTTPSVTVGVQRLRAALYEFYLPENPMYVDGDVPGGALDAVRVRPDRRRGAAPDGGRARLARPGRSAIGLWVEPEPTG